MPSVRSSLRTLSLLLCLALPSTASPRHHRLHRRQSGYTNTTSTFQGCYTDNASGQRALGADTTSTGTMTVQVCSAYCRRYQFFGLEYGRECWCGDAVTPPNGPARDDAECSFPCAGNAAETCGAGDRLSIYQNGAYALRAPAAIPGAPYAGCYVDSGAPHPLPSDVTFSTTDMTGAKCALNCAGYRYFGTQYGQECYCGDFPPPPASRVPDADCSLSCTGNNDELCGAGNRLTVYERVEDQNPPAVPSLPTTTATPTRRRSAP